MSEEAQLSWEKRAAPWAAGAAFAAVALQVVSTVVGATATKDARPQDPLPLQRALENFHAHAGAVLGSQVAIAVANFLAAAVLFYLFRATRHRRPELPPVVQWLLVIGPVLLAIAVPLGWAGNKDAADKYVSAPDAAHAGVKPTNDQRKDARAFCKARHETNCVARRTHREALAKKLGDDSRSPLTTAAAIGGTLALGFSYVIIALNAMRAGLLSRFMGILGIILGALTVLPILPGPVLQVFWLGALGFLFLGRWAGGRGPAWETGRAEPWPVPEGRGGLFAPRRQPEPEPEPAPEPQPVDRRASRKRKRKKKR